MPLDDYRYVFVITYARSGSTLLMSLINQAEGVCIRGENNAALYHLYRAVDAIDDTAFRGRTSKQEEPDRPWFGAQLVKPFRFRNRLLNTFIGSVLVPPEGTRVIGCKEIRHDMPFRSDEDFAGYINFLLEWFPNSKIVFNTRNADSVSQSAWLKDLPVDGVKRMVANCDRRFEAAMEEHPDSCFLVNYETFTDDPTRYKALFDFLDLPYEPEKIERVLNKPLTHS